jgi:hypothetical protein
MQGKFGFYRIFVGGIELISAVTKSNFFFNKIITPHLNPELTI